MIFEDRQEAGHKLAKLLKSYRGKDNTIVLGLPRGGVVTGYEVAKYLNLPLDLVVPRKIGAPNNPEYAIGAITEDGVSIIDAALVSGHNISQEYIDKEIEKEKKEAKRRLKLYRGTRSDLEIKNQTVILVDDGIATGSTMLAAIESVKSKEAKNVIVAVPVTSRSALKKIKQNVDKVIYIDAPFFFGAVGAFYEVFDQTDDQEVIELMEESEKLIKK